MKIETCKFYFQTDDKQVASDCPNTYYEHDFISLNDICCFIAQEIGRRPQPSQWSCMITTLNNRVLHINDRGYTVTYNKNFSYDDYVRRIRVKSKLS